MEKLLITEEKVPFDLLVTVPTNMGDDVIARSLVWKQN